MKNKLSAYLWGYQNIEAGEKSVETFRKFYPDSDLFLTVDVGGDIDGYTKISNKYNGSIKINSIKVGRCGIFGDYSNSNPSGDENFRTHWPKENAFEYTFPKLPRCQLLYIPIFCGSFESLTLSKKVRTIKDFLRVFFSILFGELLIQGSTSFRTS